VTDPDTPAPFEPPELFCRHLLVCRTIWYDPNKPDDGFSLGGLLVHLRPTDEHGFPLRVPRLFLFAQLFGTPGEYEVTPRLVPIYLSEDEDETEGDPIEFARRTIALTGDDFVEGFGIPLRGVPFEAPGAYEFQLRVERFDEPIGRERIEARE
jgi:hypothetical protein